MKRITVKKFVINVLLYCAIAIALYYLYSPLNNNPKNKTGSTIQFVYQQF
jgi:hypothetical protein